MIILKESIAYMFEVNLVMASNVGTQCCKNVAVQPFLRYKKLVIFEN